MRLLYIFCLYLTLFWSNLFAQKTSLDGSDCISWSENIQLRWSDFRGEPDLKSNGKAGCAAELMAQGFWDRGLPNFLVSNCFDRNASWTVDTVSHYLLEHEKSHFDIAEIHARMMRKSIDSLRKEEVNSFTPYSKIIKHLLNRRNKVDSLYDEETAHSLYSSEQLRWEKVIREQLESLSEYSSSN